MPSPSTHDVLQSHYEPNHRIAAAHGFHAYNCGYAPLNAPGTFTDFQRELVWRLLGNTTIPHDATVLDVGCGIGGPTRWIAQKFPAARVIGIEFLADSVRRARDAADPSIAFIQGDAQRIPFRDDSVDLLFNLESALHYPDKAAFLRECARVLRPGGTLCLGDITAVHKRFLAPIAWLNRAASSFNGAVQLWQAADYFHHLRETGFEIRSHENAAPAIARSLAQGLHDIAKRGWSAARGFRGRFFYLVALERMLRFGLLGYHLFQATLPPSPERNPLESP